MLVYLSGRLSNDLFLLFANDMFIFDLGHCLLLVASICDCCHCCSSSICLLFKTLFLPVCLLLSLFSNALLFSFLMLLPLLFSCMLLFDTMLLSKCMLFGLLSLVRLLFLFESMSLCLSLQSLLFSVSLSF